MLNLDIRDLEFWTGQAAKKLARDQLKRIEAANAPYMKPEAADRLISSLRRVAYPEEVNQENREAEWARNRRQLRAMLRGI